MRVPRRSRNECILPSTELPKRFGQFAAFVQSQAFLIHFRFRESDAQGTHFITFSVKADSAAGVVLGVYFDGERDKDFRCQSVSLAQVIESQQISVLVRASKIDDNFVGWRFFFARGSSFTSMGAREASSSGVASGQDPPSCSQKFRLEFHPKTQNRPVRVRQIRAFSCFRSDSDSNARSCLLNGQEELHDAALKVFHHLSQQVFGSASVASLPNSASHSAAAPDHHHELKQRVVGLIFDQKGTFTKLQAHLCEHLIKELHKEASLQARLSSSEASNDTYTFELVAMFSALIKSPAGVAFIVDHLDIVADLIQVLNFGTVRCQQEVLVILETVASTCAPGRMDSVLVPFSILSKSECNFASQLLFVLSRSMALQVRVRSGSKKAEINDFCIESSFTDDSLKNGFDGENFAPLRALLLKLSQSPNWGSRFSVRLLLILFSRNAI